MNLGLILGATLALNIGFGYFRARMRKFSGLWFLFIHLPIPVVILMRVAGGHGYMVIPPLFAVSVLGQWGGGKLLELNQKT